MMLARNMCVICGVAMVLAGCEAALPTQNELTTAAFVQPSAAGVIDIGLENVSPPRIFRTSFASGSGYAYQTGTIPNEGLFAVSGLLPDSTVAPRPSGTASYAGTYQMIVIDRISMSETFISGRQTEQSGAIVLNANFANGTLDSAPGSELTVNGSINGRNIGGTVSYNGVDGDLRGLIGGDRAIGAFQGEGNRSGIGNDNYMYAGGFIANRP